MLVPEVQENTDLGNDECKEESTGARRAVNKGSDQDNNDTQPGETQYPSQRYCLFSDTVASQPGFCGEDQLGRVKKTTQGEQH